MKKVNLILIGILLLASFLRLWRFDQVPVSLFGDELDVGYHAYSILKTGKDYSGNPWPLHFQSFAEWRTPLYLYSAVPTVAIFGISPLGVRLPAAIFGILGVWLFYLLAKELLRTRPRVKRAGGPQDPWPPLVAALLLAISPWHIQYSRAGFEVTQMLALYLAGIYFFLRGIKNGKLLVPAAIFLGLTPWAYSTAKFFLPLTLLALFLIWKKEILKTSRKHLVSAAIAFFVVVVPITWSTVFGGGTARFGHLSIFTDPTTIPEVGFARLRDVQMRDANVEFGIQPTILDRAIHNKVLSWLDIFGRNYLQSFSTQFLFIKGDLNLRHSPDSVGQFYRLEILFLILGSIFFFLTPLNQKIKIFVIFWALAAPIPAALTRDGGMHATRLFFFLPPLIIFITSGIFKLLEIVGRQYKSLLTLGIFGLYATNFLFYQHTYWVHYPWESERWWHAGYKEAIQTAVEESGNYESVVFSTAGEPPLIFFLGWSAYPPQHFQQQYPLKTENLPAFGELPKIDKYYFGTLSAVSLEEFVKVLPRDLLYVADAREVGSNLILEPEKKPAELTLVKSVTYPSGEPAFYIFSRK